MMRPLPTCRQRVFFAHKQYSESAYKEMEEAYEQRTGQNL